MAPVESRDAQMSKPVTKGETMVICVGAQGRDEGTRTHGCCPASPPHTLVEDQGRGIDDDPCVQRLRGWGGGWGSELRPMPTGGLGGGDVVCWCCPSAACGRWKNTWLSIPNSHPAGPCLLWSHGKSTCTRTRGLLGAEHSGDPHPHTPPPQGLTVATTYCSVPQSRTLRPKRLSRYWEQRGSA